MKTTMNLTTLPSDTERFSSRRDLQNFYQRLPDRQKNIWSGEVMVKRTVRPWHKSRKIQDYKSGAKLHCIPGVQIKGNT